MALGFVVLSTLEVGSSYVHFLAGLLPFGAGMALAGAPATTAIVASLPRSKQGVASAVNDVSRELGGALGIAVLGSLMNGVYRAEMADSTGSLPAGVGEQARGSLAAAQQIGEQLGPQGQQLVLHAQTAFLARLHPRSRRRRRAPAPRRALRRRPCPRPRRVPVERDREADRRRRGRERLSYESPCGRRCVGFRPAAAARSPPETEAYVVS